MIKLKSLHVFHTWLYLLENAWAGVTAVVGFGHEQWSIVAPAESC